MTTIAEEEDFGDDEDFGLVDGTGAGDISGLGAGDGDTEEDLYADITAGQTPQESSTDLPGKEKLVAERVSSGQHAEASGSKAVSVVLPKPQQQGGQHATLPKKLADTVTVYIGELQWWTTDAELETLCAEFGEIEAITFFEDKSNGKSKGYALVRFSNKEAANLCRHTMNGMEINGKKCVVTFSSSGNPKTTVTTKEPSSQSGANGSAIDKGVSTAGRGQTVSARGRMGRTAMSRPAEPYSGGMGMAPPMPPMMPGMGMPGMGMPGMGMPGMGMPGMGMPGMGMPGMGMPGMGMSNQFLPMPGMPFMGGMQQGQGNNEEDMFNKRRRY